MLFRRALASTALLLGGSATAFNVAPSGGKKRHTPSVANKNLASVIAAGVISATALLPAGSATAADSLVLGTPLGTKLASFGAASYPVFNSIKDVSPLADKFLSLVDTKAKAPAASRLAQTAVDGLLAIPDADVAEYAGVLKRDVYAGVRAGSCVTLGGSGAAAGKLAASAAVRSVPPSRIEALREKFKAANAAVPVQGGDICLPGSAAASEKLWVAQAELTFGMPPAEARALVASIVKAGLQTPRTSLLLLVPTAEGTFSKSPEALSMLMAGKEVEPNVIATVNAALR